MRTSAVRAATFAALAATAIPASAASYTATNATLRAVFAKARAGDTIILRGNFDAIMLSDRSFATPVKIDARQARFSGTLALRNVNGLDFTGGTYGSAKSAWQNAGTIRVDSSSNISFTQPRLIGNGLGRARGMTFTDSKNLSVTGGDFSGFRLALGAVSSTDGIFANNKITRSTSDGINIANSHRITAQYNRCSGTTPSVGAHPDCIQLWSLAGNPVQSDIQLLYNIATGPTQGFTSFDADRGGGLRISMIGNRVDTSFPQGIACYSCFDSIITDNVLTTQPGARWRTRLNVVGGANNRVENNSIGPFDKPAAPIEKPGAPKAGTTASALMSLNAFELAEMADGGALDVFDQFEAIQGQWAGEGLAAVPEPGVWAQLITGFGLLGGLLRLRRGRSRSTQMLAQKAH
jgi:hypothetical protein